MKPLAGQASEGRANSKGIPCLYLSTLRDTALSEIRPWLGMSISVAQFKAVRELKLVDCISKTRPELRYLFSEPPPEERDEVMWYRIDSAFSEPINPTDTSADYAPTQIIAEMFKSEGFDGLAYRSAFIIPADLGSAAYGAGLAITTTTGSTVPGSRATDKDSNSWRTNA